MHSCDPAAAVEKRNLPLRITTLHYGIRCILQPGYQQEGRIKRAPILGHRARSRDLSYIFFHRDFQKNLALLAKNRLNFLSIGPTWS